MKRIGCIVYIIIALPGFLQAQASALRKDSLAIDSLMTAAWKIKTKDPLKSITLLKKAEQLQQQTGNNFLKDVLYYYLGVVYKNLNRFTESEEYLNKYEAHHTKINNTAKLAAVKMAKANLYSDQGLWDKSMDAVTQSLKYHEQLNDTAGILTAISKLGYLLTEVNRPRDALVYHRRAISFAAILNDSTQISVALTNLGVVHEKLKQYDSALYYYNLSLKINEPLQDDMGLVYDYYNIGNMLMKQQQDATAEPWVRKALATAQKINAPGEITFCRLLLGTLLLNTGKTAEGIELLENTINNKAYDISLKDFAESYRDLYHAYKKLGQTEKALAALEKYKSANDSMLNENVAGQLNKLEVQYQTEKKEKEIAVLSSKNELSTKEIAFLHVQEKLNAVALLRERERRQSLLTENALMDSIVAKEKINNGLLASENKLKQGELQKETALKAALNRENGLKSVQLKKERAIKTGLVTGLALLLLSAGVILYLYQNQKKKNRIIQKQSDDLQVLMKEIHHRVKNNMQIVSSLLDLQSISIKDTQASEAVKEGKNRVQSMALIHQNLYSEDNLKGIKAKQYISNLLQNLADSYNISNDKVKIVADIQDLNLDVDTMIPVGLILNELLTNAFKYAFTGDNKGLLEVELKQHKDSLLLKVKDNGPGFPSELDAKTAKSFGLRMIRAFAQKLKANIHITNANGALVELNITKFALA
jgi:two-component system, sensor histidine kinase PdtaS